MADKTLDCTGLNCPMPIVEITKAVRTMSAGETLEVTASDLAFKLDVEAWSRRTGNAIVSFEQDELQLAVIQVGS